MDFSTMKLKIAEGAYESLAPFRLGFFIKYFAKFSKFCEKKFSRISAKFYYTTFLSFCEILLRFSRKKKLAKFPIYNYANIACEIRAKMDPFREMSSSFRKLFWVFHEKAYFRRDFGLICNNCMLYNTPDTIYHKDSQNITQIHRTLQQQTIGVKIIFLEFGYY